MEKAENGSLGFALVGGRNGRAILIKAISPDSIADLDGRLQVGDILLKVRLVLHHFGLFFFSSYSIKSILFSIKIAQTRNLRLPGTARGGRWCRWTPGGQKAALGPPPSLTSSAGVGLGPSTARRGLLGPVRTAHEEARKQE